MDTDEYLREISKFNAKIIEEGHRQEAKKRKEKPLEPHQSKSPWRRDNEVETKRRRKTA